jgi:hypothetical protein
MHNIDILYLNIDILASGGCAMLGHRILAPIHPQPLPQGGCQTVRDFAEQFRAGYLFLENVKDNRPKGMAEDR